MVLYLSVETEQVEEAPWLFTAWKLGCKLICSTWCVWLFLEQRDFFNLLCLSSHPKLARLV
jgi:hypothetical protein